jgi:hypothetical protein
MRGKLRSVGGPKPGRGRRPFDMKASVRFRTEGLKPSYLTHRCWTSDDLAPATKAAGCAQLTCGRLLVGLFLWFLDQLGASFFREGGLGAAG